MTRVLVTGASGFIGTAVCAEALGKGWEVRGAVRSFLKPLVKGVEACPIGDLRDAVWEPALQGVDAVIHLAGVAHQIHGQNAEAVYHAINCAAAERLARAAARAGVRRFVFVSSIKVNGESTPPHRPFRSGDSPQPQDRYARSKWAAEQALANVAAETRLETVVVRPPLVYGPGVGANFLRLVRLVDSRLPLPFGAIRNSRSLIFVGNLAQLLALCATSPAAAGRTLLASDGNDVSTPQLARKIGAALGFTTRLLPFPSALLPSRLVDSLAVDSSDTRRVLDWLPRFTLDEGIAQTVKGYRH